MSDPRYRCSFETVAEQYERARPEYAEESVDWLVERLGLRPGSRVLDLGAGTGKLTRQLVRRGLEVVAVEPGDEMRGVLQRVLPEVDALAGTSEAIPLPDASVDAVTAGQAFHWFEREPALSEMARVLRPGGGIALLWNAWDEEDPLLGAIDELLAPHRPSLVNEASLDTWRKDPFGSLQELVARQIRLVTGEQLVEWATSTSGMVNAPRAEQDRIAAAIRQLAGAGECLVSIRTDALVAQLTRGSSGMRETSS
ncbi:MAG TPA: methyltransferase domain-containing protein [Gaiellaceae bacterium]|nr:methyltransferase domain-containing protein [Gaiellaceae bacterium]